MQAEPEIRRELDARLSPPVTSEEWDLLQPEVRRPNKGQVPDIQGLLERINELRSAYLSPPRYVAGERKVKRASPTDLGERTRAQSVILAAQAAKDSEVIGFRQEVLAGELLDWDELQAFLERSDKTLAKTIMVTMVVPSDTPIEFHKAQQITGTPVKLEALVLAYGVPGSEWTHRVGVVRGGTLGRLKEVCSNLVNTYGWTEAQACVFVLTGVTPLVSRVRSTTSLTSRSPGARIELSVDPTVTPKELSDNYRSVRNRLLGARHRSPSTKHLRLAAFMATRSEEESWTDLLDAWNKQCTPPERYPANKKNTFVRDCKAATRLFGESKLKHSGRGD